MDPNVSTLANVIQLAVAPVFLLAGIAGFLNVMSGRLGRIVDRARILEKRVAVISDEKSQDIANYELKIIWRRIHIINRSIGLCTASALMVCLVVVGLFVGDFWAMVIDELVVGMFVLALSLLVLALLMFLKEVQLATRTLKRGRTHS